MFAQTSTVPVIAGPDERVSAGYLRLWNDCSDGLRRRADSEDMALTCLKLANAADRFAPESHPIARREAYVLYATALIRTEAYSDATKMGDKAVRVAEEQHDDSFGAGAAYYTRGHARGLAGDLPGANSDLDIAEADERKTLAGVSDIFLRAEATAALKHELEFHSQVLDAMHQSEAAQAKNDEAEKL